jgi:NADPH:quinone reductase-like Zn-dependent oxidoreductase
MMQHWVVAWTACCNNTAVFAESALVRLPSHFTFEEGATLPCAGVTSMERSGHPW